jgi:hypothetical protein
MRLVFVTVGYFVKVWAGGYGQLVEISVGEAFWCWGYDVRLHNYMESMGL